MNRTFPETATGNYCPSMTAHEQQRPSHNGQLHQQQESYLNYFVPGLNSEGTFCMTSQGLVLDPDTYNSWPVPLPPVSGMNTSTQVAAEVKVKLVDGKRKFDKFNIKTEDDNGENKMKGNTDKAESKLTSQSKNHCKEINSKNSHVQKTDYIHVRARRGQATDSHSLAERVRREKISERMKFLQDLVPGCNKIIGKAGMLDEIINYVQSLQGQVEFLSMKLAVANPRLDVDLFAKEITPACTPDFPSIEMPPNFLPQSATWEDISLQNLYNVEFQQGRTIPFPSHQYTGSLETGNMKIQIQD